MPMNIAFHARKSGDARIHWLAGRWLFNNHSPTTALQANNDVRITGSNVVSTGDTTLLAGHDITMDSRVRSCIDAN
jgi:hypothetical protein